MTTNNLPLVSIVTPAYNGEAYLEECIESVLAQTYTHWEYIIVNNFSSDKTGEIAERYARKDPRIRVYTNDKLLNVIANHNHAFSLMSPGSKYCKVVSADDLIFPECVARMVHLAEQHPSVGIVGSYQVSGGGDDWCVRCTGLPYWREVISGTEICRLHLLNGLAMFGAPTSNMYRSELVRASDAFFPNSRAEADISACFKHLQHTDFGFVHQVLSYERCHTDRITTASRSFTAYPTSRISDLQTYGPAYVSAPELKKCLEKQLDNYYTLMGIAVVNFRERAYWDYQKARLAELGLKLDRVRLAKAACLKVLDLLVNPRVTAAKLARRRSVAFPQSNVSVVSK
jgi:glycosyltransferase involved in cell wall biosynthesis